MWDYLGPVAAVTEPRFRTHRYDQRGCGRSSANTDHRMARHVADLDELRAHLGHDRWYVFGHSFGATLGLLYAATHPDRVADLAERLPSATLTVIDGAGHQPCHERPDAIRTVLARLP